MHLLLLLLLLPFHVLAQDCTPANLKVFTLPLEVKHDYTKDSNDLFRIAGKPVYGLVATRNFVKVEGCTVTVGYHPMQLFITKELRANRCLFDWVLQHELRHIEVYRQTLQRAKVELRRGDMSDLRARGEELLWGSWWPNRRIDIGDEGKIYEVCNSAILGIFP